MIDFVRKTPDELESMSYEQKRLYFENLKDYVLSLPFDEDFARRGEEKFINTMGGIVKLIRKHMDPQIYGNSKPLEVPTIIVSNHLGSLDSVVVNTPYPDEAFHYMIAASLLKAKNLWQGYFFRNRGAFVVDKNDPVDKKMGEIRALQYLFRDMHIMMFPEGTRRVKYGSDGSVTDFKKGAAEIAQASGANVRPTAINNNFKKSGLYVNVGEDILVGYDDNVFEKTDEIQQSVTELWHENKTNGALILTKNPK